MNLDAAIESGKRWEEDAIGLLEALDEPVTVETCDSAANCAHEKIKALKYIAFEVAAYGDCDCDREARPNELCLYCIAVAVTKALKPTDGPCDYMIPNAQPESESTK